MAARVELLFRAEAKRLLPRRGTVLAAVSGGADSVALLHLLAHFAARRPLRIVIAHIDHGMRRGSVRDRRFVERLAAELGFPCLAVRREVVPLRRRGESVEEAARRVRRSFLLEAAAEADAARIATGHTLDDQAETVLMRLARGAGLTALSGMDPSGPAPFVRPLLGIERADLHDWLRRHGHEHREDPTNRSLLFERNRVRRIVLPALAAALNPRAARHLAEAAGRLRQDAELLDDLARRRSRRILGSAPRGRLVIRSGLLARAPAPLAARIARLALERAGADPRRVGARQIEAILDLARGGEGRRIDLPGGLDARRRGDGIVVGKRADARR
jgi:tRNA(Ile)-lysidine synthase